MAFRPRRTGSGRSFLDHFLDESSDDDDIATRARQAPAVLAPDTPSPEKYRTSRRRRPVPAQSSAIPTSGSSLPKRSRKNAAITIPSSVSSETNFISDAVNAVVESVHVDHTLLERLERASTPFPTRAIRRVTTPETAENGPRSSNDSDVSLLGVFPASSEVLNRIRQLEDDETMARRLQREFDVEVGQTNHIPQFPTPHVQLQRVTFNPEELSELARIELTESQRRRPRVAPTRSNNRSPARVQPTAAATNGRARRTMQTMRFNRRRNDAIRRNEIRLHQEQMREVIALLGQEGQGGTDHQQSYEALLDLVERLGDSGYRGLSKSQLDQLGTGVWDGSGSSQTVVSCTICICDFEIDDKYRLLPCSHRFHIDCIDTWLKQRSSCPICRLDVRRGLGQEPAQTSNPLFDLP